MEIGVLSIIGFLFLSNQPYRLLDIITSHEKEGFEKIFTVILIVHFSRRIEEGNGTKR